MIQIKNPVLKGFNPDPSIVRVDNVYYIAVSTFEWFPGVTIYRSKDLNHWEFAAAPLNEGRFMDLKGIDTACGIWAPNLTWADGRFYLLYTVVYTNRSRFKDTHNFLITADAVEGSWSDPVFLNCSGFDPSLFHDEGRKWLVNMTIDHRPDRERFSGVDIQEYDPLSQKLTGRVHRIFKGSPIGTTEGPNLMKHNGYYYLTCAEGGTEFGHCVTVARAKEITGPYEVDPENPMLTSKAADSYPIQRAGHGQLVEGKNGRWYMAHLCSRPVDHCSILGRETALQNIKWTEDGWFRLSKGGTLPYEFFESYEDEVENRNEVAEAEYEVGMGDKVTRTTFENAELPWQFLTLREPASDCGIDLKSRPGWLRIHGGNSLSSKYRQGLIARRQQKLSFQARVKLEFCPGDYHHMAGLVCYYNYDNYYYARVSRDEEPGRCVLVTSVVNRDVTESGCIRIPETGAVFLKAQVQREELQFYASMDGKEWQKLGMPLDMRNLSDERVNGNGFAGAMVGICCQDLQGDGCAADFEWFDYEELKD